LYLKSILLIVANLALVVFFIYLLRKPGRLSYYLNGRWWLTWLSVAVITLMDELTSVFYAPAEAYRFIGPSAIIFIAFTAVFVHYMTPGWWKSPRFWSTTGSSAAGSIPSPYLASWAPGVLRGGGLIMGGLHPHRPVSRR